MKSAGAAKDLVVLVADRNKRDPGCLRLAHDFLRAHSARYHHALVMFDHDGCGQEHKNRAALEQQVEAQLAQAGWGDRAATVVLDPELEAWVWSDSPHVETALGWQNRTPGLRSWLMDSKLLGAGEAKPKDPKRAVEEALRLARKPRSSTVYLEIASSVSFEGCTDAAFLKLRDTLTRWFSAGA